MANPVELLHNEHIQLTRLLDLLETCVRTDLRGARVQEARELMNCLARFPNQFHHPVEDLLFERMLARDQSLTQLLDELNVDHQRLAEQGERLMRELQRATTAPEQALSALRSLGMSYIEMFRTHMEVEETDLFSLADGLLEADDWRFVEAGIDRLRAEGLDAPAARCYEKFGARCAS